MRWEAQADKRAREILEDLATELFEEAERVARRLRAGAVSEVYVDEAAFTVRLRRPSGLGDILLGIGLAMLGVAGGVLAIIATATTPLHLKAWVDPTFIAVACIGFLLAGIGGTLKIKAT